MEQQDNNIYSKKIFGSKMGRFTKRFFLVIFSVLLLLLVIFLSAGIKDGVAITGILTIIILGGYFGIISNQNSFFIENDALIIRNEYLYFNQERFRTKIKKIEKLNYRFDNSPKYGKTHLTIYTDGIKKKIKIIATLEETESLIETFIKLKISVSFSNILTNEQRKFALKWLNNGNLK